MRRLWSDPEKIVRWTREAWNNPLRRLQVAILALVLLIVYATVGYMLIEKMNAIDALYMTAITVTTVGFGEVRPLSPAGRVFTISVILLGVGIATTAITEGLRLALEPVLWLTFQRRRMEKTVKALENHYIVCGYGRVGRQVVRDLRARQADFVLIDSDEGLEERLLEARFPFVIGDATREETLAEAGIQRARGLVTVLTNDADNIMTVLTARMLRPDLSIISRVVHAESEQKLRAVGAHHVINPYQIGGHRLALSMLRPAVNEFLHRIYHFDESPFIDIGQITLQDESRIVGQTIMTCDLRSKYQVNILAIQQPNGEMIITPAPDYILKTGETLVIMGPSEQVYQLERERPESI